MLVMMNRRPAYRRNSNLGVLLQATSRLLHSRNVLFFGTDQFAADVLDSFYHEGEYIVLCCEILVIVKVFPGFSSYYWLFLDRCAYQ
jgi:hypothetical protein